MAITVFCLLSLLLFAGKIIRVSIPLLQKCYLPSSVIGGVLGLILFQCFPQFFNEETVQSIAKIPGFMINIVFATLFLGVATPPLKKVFQVAFPQLCFGQIMAWGQYVIGFAAAGWILIPFFGAHEGFGNLLEIGFQGGHGTVGGMSESFRTLGWEDGIALGYTVATAGMILGVVVGMMLVNWAGRKGYVKNIRQFESQNKLQQLGIYRASDRPTAGWQTVYSDSIDSLAWHIALVGIVVLCGYGILEGLRSLEIFCFPNGSIRIFKGFPLFPLCMIGGLVIQKIARLCKVDSLVDHGQMQRLAGAALDFLVLSAMATIKIAVVADNWKSLLTIIVLGLLFALFMVIRVAPRLFKESWFECAIADFGQALGVTATGLLLLRSVDPESKTCAAQAFGYKQLLHEPFMGGGLWTATALTLLFQFGWKIMLCISSGAMLVWIVIAVILCRKNGRSAACGK